MSNKQSQIKEKLNMLSELRSQLSKREEEKKELLESVIPPEIKAKIAEINEEFDNTDIISKVDMLTSEIKQAVIEEKESVKGDYLIAIYTNGKVFWDTNWLDRYVLAHPELEKYRRTREPSVIIRGL